MQRGKLSLFLIISIFILIFSTNTVFGENFTAFDNKIKENDYVNLDSDIILNQNNTNEEKIYGNGILIKDKEIHIEGNNHEICGKDSYGSHVKILNIKNSNVTLTNMKICSAKFNGEGGAISLDETSSLTLINVTFKENSAIGIYGEGGAIYSTGTLKIYDSKFEDNYASGAGGAVYSLTSNCEIDSSKFNNNSAKWYGGAIFSNYQLIVSSSTFTQNNAYSGGVLHYTLTQVADIESAIFNRTLFSKNAAIYGGVFSTSALNKIIALNSSFTENYATRGGILYKNGQSASYIQNCLVENNSAEFGAVICDDSYDGYYKNRITFNGIINSTLNNNFALKSSIYYGREGNLLINQSIINNAINNPIFNGKGNITVLNSKILNSHGKFITQTLYGNIIFINNTFESGNGDLNTIIDSNKKTQIIAEGNYDNSILALNMSDYSISPIKIEDNTLNLTDLDCCSVIVRINQSEYAISHRRDGGSYNFTLYLDKDDDFIRQFKTISTNFCLSKVYTNGWVIGAGGWDDSGENEKIEAIASDMVKNENINLEALELILKIKRTIGLGHLLIVAPNGTYGNVIVDQEKEFIKMDVLDDGDYIISPNSVDYRREGHLNNIYDVVESNIDLSAQDQYGLKRHCILVHHITRSETDFVDDIYVSNEDGKFVNRDNSKYCDNVWFNEKYTPSYKIPLSPKKIYVGRYYSLNKTIISYDANKEYNSNYNYLIQLFNYDNEYLSNIDVNITVNGKTKQYTTNAKGEITIRFVKLTGVQTIIISNPITGEIAKNSIKIIPRIVGSNIEMGYFDGTNYKVKVYDKTGKLAGKNQIVTIKLNKKTYKVKTNSKGIATLKLPNTLIPKEYTLTAIYAGKTIKNTIKVKQTLKTKSITIKKTSKLVLKATLKTIKNKAIKNMKISFKFKGKSYTAKTNTKGVASVSINKKIIKKLKIGKKYSFKVIYLKNTIESTVKVRQ